MILPYVANIDVANSIRPDQPWDAPANCDAAGVGIGIYKSPGAPQSGPVLG